jgi:hypothetical protein
LASLRFVKLLLFLTLCGLGSAQADAGFSIILTAKTQDGVPSGEASSEFGCGDRIYAVITVKGLTKSQHLLEAIWRDPHGKDREHTRYPFVVRYDQERIWVWLKLHRPPEAALVQFMDPSAGMDEFVGEWRVEVLVDGRVIEQKKFNVIC